MQRPPESQQEAPSEASLSTMAGQLHELGASDLAEAKRVLVESHLDLNDAAAKILE